MIQGLLSCKSFWRFGNQLVYELDPFFRYVVPTFGVEIYPSVQNVSFYFNIVSPVKGCRATQNHIQNASSSPHICLKSIIITYDPLRSQIQRSPCLWSQPFHFYHFGSFIICPQSFIGCNWKFIYDFAESKIYHFNIKNRRVFRCEQKVLGLDVTMGDSFWMQVI